MDQVLHTAIGTSQIGIDHRPMLWALLSALKQHELHTQVFLARSHFVCSNGAIVVTGQDYRHLDTWLMPPELCRQLFAFGSRSCDAAVVEGRFGTDEQSGGGDLDLLCQWLDLSKLVIVDVTQLRTCCLPPMPDHAAGILLDNVANDDEARQVGTALEALFGVPVLGWLPRVPQAREIVAQLAPGTRPATDLCRYLGEQFLPRFDIERLQRIAVRPRSSLSGSLAFQPRRPRPLTVAIAFDDAFQCYFQDAFDLLEALGATLRDFSPLRGDLLPCDADIVYFGCGPVPDYAQQLARNCCMREAIRRYVRRGGRVYAECGGLAYLSKQLQLPSGRQFPMAGILPVVVKLSDEWHDFVPVEVMIRESSWIGRPGQQLRGYLNPNWQVTPVGPVRRCGYVSESANAFVSYENVIGSQVHVNFAAHADLLRRFFVPPADDLAARPL